MTRARSTIRSRKENTREERKTLFNKELLTFNFKYLDQTQPKDTPETIDLWESKKLLKTLFVRLVQLSELTRDEAIKQKQLKFYGSFPPTEVTKFSYSQNIPENVVWGVIEGLGGRPRVAGFIEESTFYVVFLDSEHCFWKSEKKHT